MPRMRSRHNLWWASIAIVALLFGVYSYWALHRPLPALTPIAANRQLIVTSPASTIAWPAQQAAVGIVGQTTIETHGVQKPAPTASTAKIITALVILQKKPLKAGEQGPLITITAADMALYKSYLAANGSVLRVQPGEQLSEYQMLQALLLPSANNIADGLAIWAYGSLDAYAAAANGYLASIGIQNTHVGKDASGLDASTTSTAEDLVKLGSLVMQNPVLSKIVGQSTASGFPLVGTVKNVNFLLGKSSIVGIKTGNSDQAGGVFVSAARVMLNAKPVTVVTALVGAPTLFSAVQGSLPFIQSSEANFKPIDIVKAGATIGHYHIPWGGSVDAVATNNLRLTTWAGRNVMATINLKNTTDISGKNVGQVTVQPSAINNQTSVTVKLKTAVTPPSASWRLLHPFN